MAISPVEIEDQWKPIVDTQKSIEEETKRLRDSINKSYLALNHQLRKLKTQEKALKEFGSNLKSKDCPEHIEKQFEQVSKSIEQLRAALAPRTGSLFVRFLLGRVNVKNIKDADRLALKTEYQKFKMKTDILFLVSIFIQLFFRHPAIELLFQVWLLYYYITLALRENILKVNGSNIKEWWIIHHYISIALSLTILLWPRDSESYITFFPQFLYFSFAQGIVQIMQNRYQSNKLYKLTAMGKINRMDVTGELESPAMWEESSCSPGLTCLLPFLLFVQLMQLYNSYSLFMLALHYMENVLWNVIASALLFCALGVGNMYTTLYTYKEKYHNPKKNS